MWKYCDSISQFWFLISLFYFSFFSLFFSIHTSLLSFLFFFPFFVLFFLLRTHIPTPLFIFTFFTYFLVFLPHSRTPSSFFLFLLSLSSLLFLFFYFFYSWQYIVNFSPHTSCIILQLDGPLQTKVRNMKNLIWERERELVEKKNQMGLSFFSFYCSDFIWLMRKNSFHVWIVFCIF